MSKMQELLEGRFAASDTQKVKALAKQSASGELTSFSGLFKPIELVDRERQLLETLLHQYQTDADCDHERDFATLVAITSEVKAISNQAALLHGERIQRAQKILKNYREGAFSAWLITVYGNRQTPYNFLLYYEFYQQLPQELKRKLESIPKQAIYALSSRQASFDEKQQIVASYDGETKQQMLEAIRTRFPLAKHDKRRQDETQTLLSGLEKLIAYYQQHKETFDEAQKKAIKTSLKKFLFFIDQT